MKAKLLIKVLSLLFLLSFIACDDDDDEMASIVGKWQGTKVEADITPTGSPLSYTETDEDFNAVLEFKTDGTVSVVYNGQSSTGTYSVQNNKLITDITFNTDFIELSGTYTIEELTETKLELYIEKQGSIDVPNVGTVSGTAKTTLFFDKQ